jgi:L-asparaginase II
MLTMEEHKGACWSGVELSRTTRGEWKENSHAGHLATQHASGAPAAFAGDSGSTTFMRSTAKPFLAAAGIAAGLVEHYGLPEGAIALMSASHRGGPEHIGLLEKMLELTGIREEQLAFHADLPLGQKERDDVMRLGLPPRKLYHTCSGKHIGLLALCRMKGWPLEGYTAMDHPLQRELLRHIALFTDLDESAIGRAVDGCGLPVFVVPLDRLALAYARLASPPEDWADAPLRAAARRVSAAMLAYPNLVEGEGRLASVLLAAGIVAKSGAQGVFALALPEAGLGIAFKVADGGENAWPVIAASVLEQLADRLQGIDAGKLADAAAKVREAYPEEMDSDTGIVTGRHLPVVQLEWS